MKRRLILLLSFIALNLTFSASCTRVVAYASDSITDPFTHRYGTDIPTAFVQCQKVLENLGYSIQESDEFNGKLVTSWRPTGAGTHYLVLFGSKDYSGNAGSYYQLMIEIDSNGSSGIKVKATTKVKSLSGHLTSSGQAEGKFLSRLDDALRSPQIEITNVGVTNK